MLAAYRSCLWLLFLAAALCVSTGGCEDPTEEVPGVQVPRIPAKTVVLTFDDAQRTHLTFVAPLLREYGFGGTFFVSARWMEDEENYLSWPEVAELHRMGFEVGNHSHDHNGMHIPRAAEFMAEDLGRVDAYLEAEGVPRTVSFAWPGGVFGPEAMEVLRVSTYRLARRCMQPDVATEEITERIAPAFDPLRHDRFLVPTTGEARALWTMEHFEKVVGKAVEGRAVVLTFHGVPDSTNADLSVSEARFVKYMDYLRNNGFHVIAMRELWPYVDGLPDPEDPLATVRHPSGR